MFCVYAAKHCRNMSIILKLESEPVSSPQSYVKSGPGIQSRTLCDRVIRACNHQLGVGSPNFDHVTLLVQLVELSLHCYDISAALVAQSSPLYMEKILFHIVKKLSSLEDHNLCSHAASLLYSRLVPTQQVCIISYIQFIYMSSTSYPTQYDCFFSVCINKVIVWSAE